MSREVGFQVFMIFSGLLCMAGGVFDWDWFMNHRRARPFVSVLGRMGARVFYVILGLVFFMFGALYVLTAMMKGS